MVEKDIRTHGSCLCRAVAYAVAGRPGPMWHCHCPICRKLSGAHGYVEQKRRGSRLLTTCHSLPSILPQGSIGGKVASWSEGDSLPKNVNGDARRN